MDNFSLFTNDPLYTFLRKFNLLNQDSSIKVWPVILISIFVTWVPLFLLANGQSLLLNLSNSESFLYDFAAHAQFLVCIPILIIAEHNIDIKIRDSIRKLFEFNILGEKEKVILQNNITSFSNRKTKYLINLIAFLLAIILTLWLVSTFINFPQNTWHIIINSTTMNKQLSNAGWWHATISSIINLYWPVRWSCYILIWLQFLWKLSKIKLNICTGHPDLFGGLGFLSQLQNYFGLLIFSLGINISATSGYAYFIAGFPLNSLIISADILLYLILSPIILLIPLFYFTPQLSRAKKQNIEIYSKGISNILIAHESLFILNNSKNPAKSSKITSINFTLDNLNMLFTNTKNMKTSLFDIGMNWTLIRDVLAGMIPIIVQTYILPQIGNLIKF